MVFYGFAKKAKIKIFVRPFNLVIRISPLKLISLGTFKHCFEDGTKAVKVNLPIVTKKQNLTLQTFISCYFLSESYVISIIESEYRECVLQISIPIYQL